MRAPAPYLPLLLALVACAPKTANVSAGPPPKSAGVPARPEELVYPELVFTPPSAADHRSTLASGVPVYVAPSHDLPLVTITFTFRGGDYLDPDDQTGLATVAMDLIRNGGTTREAPEVVDESLAFLAANVSTSAGDTTCTVSLDVTRDNLDEALPLVVEMLRTPRFDEARRELLVETWVEDLKGRNDDAGDILSREWPRLMFGESHIEAEQVVAPELQSIDAEDLRAWHRRVIQPANLLIAVTGDIERDAIVAQLDQALAGWEKGEVAPPPAEAAFTPEPGLYHIQKDTPQGKVRIGLRGIQRDDPDAVALSVMNEILGGGGFTSRIMARVRSDEGLAYGARSGVAAPYWWPGTISAGFDSKNATVALATSIVLEEFDRIRNEKVTDQELADAKAGLLANLPRQFSSRDNMLRIFVSDEITKRDPAYWSTLQDKVRAVTVDDVQRVAQAHLKREEPAMLVVGVWEPIAKGDAAGRATMAPFGEVRHVPLRDPLTLGLLAP